MAKAGKHYHWKHGWIPLDAFARAQLVRRKKGLPLTVDEKRAELDKRRAARGESPLKPRTLTKAESDLVKARTARAEKLKKAGPPSKVDVRNGVFHVRDANGTVLHTGDGKSTRAFMVRKGLSQEKADKLTMDALITSSARERYRKITTVDGVDFITFTSVENDPLLAEHGEPWQMDEAQMQVVADAYNEVKAEFPGMEKVQIVGVQGKPDIFGITTWDGRRISIAKDTFSDKARAVAHRNFGQHGAIAGQFTDDAEAFARAVVVHELGHALQMQNATAKRRGDALATEKGWPKPVPDGSVSFPRWSLDTLNSQSVYGTGNQWEWFAEAFADGWFNGADASPGGKAAIGILKDVYGKKVAA